MQKIYIVLSLILFPAVCSAQFQKAYEEMAADEKAKYENYEDLIFDATTYIFNNPVDQSSAEFVYATQIVGFWMDKNTGVNIPTFGDFFTSLGNENHQQFLYVIAMMHYGLDQKINHNRILDGKKQKRKKYNEQEDVREVQLEGAKILLDYIGKKSNNVPVPAAAKDYLVAYNNNQLESMFFNEAKQ